MGSDGGWEKGSGIVAFHRVQDTGAVLLRSLVLEAGHHHPGEPPPLSASRAL